MTLPPNRIHNHLRKLAFSSAAIAFIASSSYAESTYILQLGTFDSHEKAIQRWTELKSKNNELLGNLTMNVSEIAMAPDDKVSYRTQAGPLNSHDDANKLCNLLLEKGAECYVVETAMFTGDQAPAEAPAPLAELKTPAEKAPEEAPVSRVQPQPVEEPAPVAVSGPSTPAPAPTNTHMAVAGREPKFLDDDAMPAEKPAAVQAVPAPVAAAPIVTSVAEAEPAPAPMRPIASLSSPVAAAKAGNTTKNLDENDVSSKQQHKLKGMIVPGRGPRFLDDGEQETKVAAAPAAAAVTQEAPAAKQEKEKPGFFGRLFGSSSDSEKTAAAENKPVRTNIADSRNVVGNVNVSEAIRVPLTDGNGASASSITPRFSDDSHDSQSPIGTVNYWVQINYFADEQQAHYFYEEFQAAYPDISDSVRMRITRPYAYANKPGHVTLKIGTFNNQNYINAVCTLAAQHNLHCTKIKDTGKAANSLHEGTSIAPAKASSASMDSGFLGQPSANTNSNYWVQLGTFTSEDDAWDKWKSLKKSKKKLLGKVSASVTQPASSSAQHKLYRLRTGPFASQYTANALCNKISPSGSDCVVVSEH